MTKKNEYQIADWVVNPYTLEVSKGKEKIKVQNKVIQVLITLIEANGYVVSKEKLYEKVWPDTIVTDNSLNKAISELRKIFNDSRVGPRFIETIPNKGYRIIADIKKIEIISSKIPIYKRSKRVFILPILIMSIIFLIAIIYLKPQNIQQSVLSPNGKKIAFFKKNKTKYSLQIENVLSHDTETLLTLLKPESFVLNWSRDSNKIIYNATLDDEPFYSINIISLDTYKILYMKFAKDNEGPLTDLVPENLKRNSELINYKRVISGNNKIHHIYLEEKDTIRILFKNKKVSDFKW